MPVDNRAAARFRDRRDAGRQLAERLGDLRPDHPIVVGIPRGGLVVAAEVASALGAPLDLVVLRKVFAPHEPELSIGAIVEGDESAFDWEAIERLGIGALDLARIVARETRERERRLARFRAVRGQIALSGRVVILVDDGLVTGVSVIGAANVMYGRGASRLVLAVPVASAAGMQNVRHRVDAVVCLEVSDPLSSLGEWYAEFPPISDEKVIALLGSVAGRITFGDQDLRMPGA